MLLDKEYGELYIASLFIMGLQNTEGLDFWMAKPISDPPDVVFMTIVSDSSNKMEFLSREVEITRSLPGTEILDAILKKDKAYPGDYILLCFIERNETVELPDLSKTLTRKLNNNIDNIFFVFNGTTLDEFKNIKSDREIAMKASVVQISPIYDFKTIDIREELGKWEKDEKKLIYTEGTKVFYGLRDGETSFPKILS